MTNKKNKHHKRNDHQQTTSKIMVNQEELTSQCLEMHQLLKNRTNKLRAMKNNELCYLLSSNWLRQWKEYVGYDQLVGEQQQKSNKKDKRFGKKHPGKINTDITANISEIREYYTIPKEMESYQYLNQLTNEKKEKDDDFIAVTPEIWFQFLNYYEGEQIRRPVKTIKGSIFYDGQPLRCDVIFANLQEEGLEEKIKKTNKKNYNGLFPSQKFLLSTLWTIKQLKNFLAQYCSIVYNTSKIRIWKGFSYVATNPIIESLIESIKDRKFLIKARQLTEQRYKEHQIDYYIKSTHTLIVQFGDILKTDNHQEQQIKGYCEQCVEKKQLTIGCICNEVLYCTQKCRTNDQNFHFYTCQQAFDSEDDQEYSKITLEQIPKSGLDNIGNTCYMNSTMQAIVSIDHIRSFFAKNQFLKHMNEKELKDNKCMLLNKFSKTIKALIQEKDSYTPWPLKSQIDYNLTPFKGDKQHDANDFLVNFLNTLNDYLKKYEDKAYHTILEPFVGEFYSKVLCPHCKGISQNNQIFLQISLPIKSKPAQKIYQYTLAESLTKVRRGKSCVFESWQQIKESINAQKSIVCKTKQPQGLIIINQEEQTPQKALKNLKGDMIFFQNQSIQEGEAPFVFNLVTTKTIVGNKLKSPYGISSIISVNHEVKTLGTFWLQIIKKYFESNPQIVAEAEKLQKQYFTEIQNEVKVKSKQISNEVKQETKEEKQKRQDQQMQKIAQHYTSLLQIFAQKIGIEVYINHFKRTRNMCKICNKKCSNCDLPKTFDLTFKSFFEDRYQQVRFQVYLRDSLTIDYVNEDKSINGDPNIQDCLELFTQPEELDQENAYYCQKCDSMGLALKELHVKAFPSILILHLNRFKTFEHKKIKNNDPIQYQEIQNFGGKQYKLVSVIIHEGSMDAGHYWSICLRDGEYYVFNDAKVTKIEKVFHKNAYILMYSLVV